MDNDPLSDTVPPRYAYESDEEDEANPLGSGSPAQGDTDPVVKLLGDIPPGKHLIIASLDVGAFWARGADLGEQTGAVYVDSPQVGLTFSPKWTESTVIASEAMTHLTLGAMHPYAETIINTLVPPVVSILDTYPVPSYITDQPRQPHEAPIRYLTTLKDTKFLHGKAEPLRPPNLIQSTSAAFLSVLAQKNIPATCILVPSPYTPPPPPKQITSGSLVPELDGVDWPTDVIRTADTLLFNAVGEEITRQWEPTETPSSPTNVKRSASGGESGMYI